MAAALALKIIYVMLAEMQFKGRQHTYRTLEVMGPEHEFSVVDEELRPLPIVDRIIKGLHGRAMNCTKWRGVLFGKEMQAHVGEFKACTPFRSPRTFEETMFAAVQAMSNMLERKYGAALLGLGMHPLLKLEEAKVWSHRDRRIYESLGELFNLNQHGWLNIQSFQLSLPYSNEGEAIAVHNALANILPYIPAVAASSSVYESRIGEYVDNRLHFYEINQKEIPSISGDIVPEYVSSFEEYRRVIISRFSRDLIKAKAAACIVGKEWMNSRGAILRFDRRAIEIRIMDEQECVKSDVALSCFIRAAVRGFLRERELLLPHALLVEDLRSVIKDGSAAAVKHPHGPAARDVCRQYLRIAERNATRGERQYLTLVNKRIEEGSLSEAIREDLLTKAQKSKLDQAILDVCLSLLRSLRENRPYA